MTTSALKELECWNCGEECRVVYGGESDRGAERCDNCGEVVAEKEIDAITIPSNKEQAKMIQERHNDFTVKERLKRRLRLLWN